MILLTVSLVIKHNILGVVLKWNYDLKHNHHLKAPNISTNNKKLHDWFSSTYSENCNPG